MSYPSSAEDILDRLAGLQHRAHTMHGDASDRRIKSDLRQLAIRIAQISATLSGSPDIQARLSAAEQAEAAAIHLGRLEGEAHRPNPDGK